jgi:hypothetical protein
MLRGYGAILRWRACPGLSAWLPDRRRCARRVEEQAVAVAVLTQQAAKAAPAAPPSGAA